MKRTLLNSTRVHAPAISPGTVNICFCTKVRWVGDTPINLEWRGDDFVVGCWGCCNVRYPAVASQLGSGDAHIPARTARVSRSAVSRM